MLSYSPNVTWADIVKEFLGAKHSRLKLKAFTNEVLARTFEEDYEKSNTSLFYDRREQYEAQVPEGVLVLSMGADVQKDRIECEVVGWGAHYENWGIQYKIFYGDTTKENVWEDFRTYILTKTFMHVSGNMMGIYAGCVDAGYLTDVVTGFCKGLSVKRIFATQGSGSIAAKKIPVSAGKTKNRHPIYTIGVNRIKDEIAWHIQSNGGAGFMHFPIDDAYNIEYFKQLGAEKKEKNGRWKSMRKRNEAIDVRVYSYASLYLGNIDMEILVARGKPIFMMENRVKKTRKERTGWMKS